MSEPSVVAIMLTKDRTEYARRAVEAFRAQTYGNKRMLIWDNGTELQPELEAEDDGVFWVPVAHVGGRAPIGELRNSAIRFWTEFPIIVHWDSDDVSHPNRIAEQVALLQSTGADVVGYNEMLFWREPWQKKEGHGDALFIGPAEAWLYTNRNPTYALGTSLCYWRKTWKRKPFEATSVGEDWRFLSGLKVQSVSANAALVASDESALWFAPNGQPRMIARIHSGNSSGAYDAAKMQRAAEWKRVPEWDSYCERVMK